MNPKARNTITMSELHMALQTIYNAINRDFYHGDLPKVVIAVRELKNPEAVTRLSDIKEWSQNNQMRYEIAVNAAKIVELVPEDIIAALMHEMVHLFCRQHGIPDTSRGGAYHNRNFQAYADNHGLDVTETEKYGWSETTPKPATAKWIKANISIKEIKLYKAAGTEEEETPGTPKSPKKATQKKKQSFRKYVCPTCGLIVRATKDCNIGCLDCGGVKMEIES